MHTKMSNTVTPCTVNDMSDACKPALKQKKWLRKPWRSDSQRSTATLSNDESLNSLSSVAFVGEDTKPLLGGVLKIRSQGYSEIYKYAPQGSQEKKVAWGDIAIRSHSMTLGDNPACSNGAPVTISWKSFDSQTIPVDVYEQHKPQPRQKNQMLLPAFEREERLRYSGISRGELKDTMKEIAKIHENRVKSSRDGKVFEKLKVWSKLRVR